MPIEPPRLEPANNDIATRAKHYQQQREAARSASEQQAPREPVSPPAPQRNWHELLAAIAEHLGLEEQSLASAHIALDALDAGAIYMTSHPTRTEVVRFDVTDDHEPEGLES